MRLGFIFVFAGLACAAGKTNVLFFISSDCPISNSYAPEIQRLCGEYGNKGIGCSLVYEDVGLDTIAMRKHLKEYRYDGMSAVIDRNRKIAKRAKATVTPEAVVIDSRGEIRYRGRIDNQFGVGIHKQKATTHELATAIDELLADKAVSTPEEEMQRHHQQQQQQ